MSSPEEPRCRLLEAAGEIFAEKGYEGATVREICKQAGVNIAAVNYYFRDKERLYIEAVKHASCGSLETTPLPSWPPGTPAADRLRDFIRVMVARLMSLDKPAWHARLMMRELAEPTSACEEWVRDYVRPNAEVLGGVLTDLLPPGTPVFKRTLTVFSIMGQCLHYMQCKPVIQRLLGDEYARITPEVVADHVAEFSLTALGVKPPRRRKETATPGGTP